MERLEYWNGTMQRFIELSVEGRTFFCTSNRARGRVQADSKEFATVQAAREHLQLVIERFLAKGYARAGEAPVGLPGDPAGMQGFEIPWAKAALNLEGVLDQALVNNIKNLAHRDPEASVLWIDEPWAEIDYDAMSAREGVALAVFTEPLACDGPLTLSAEDLIGDPRLRNDRTFVFLSEVSADAVTTLPDTTAVFAGGLRIASTGCFSAADASTYVQRRLNARTIVSGNGDGCVTVVPGTQVKVGLLCGDIQGYDGPIRTTEFCDAFPRWSERLEDEQPWEFFVEAFANACSVEPD